MGELNQLTAAGSDQTQVVLDRQASQTVEEIRSKIGVAGDVLELVQQKNDVHILAVDDIEEVGEGIVIDVLRLAQVIHHLLELRVRALAGKLADQPVSQAGRSGARVDHLQIVVDEEVAVRFDRIPAAHIRVHQVLEQRGLTDAPLTDQRAGLGFGVEQAAVDLFHFSPATEEAPGVGYGVAVCKGIFDHAALLTIAHPIFAI